MCAESKLSGNRPHAYCGHTALQAAIPPTHIAFQMGQAMAIQSGGE